jgi:hypothetical protein
MSARFIFVAAFITVLTACLLRTGPASTADIASPKLMSISPDRLQRLSAAGLHADDPQLNAHLRALASSRHGTWLRPAAKIASSRRPGSQTSWSVSLVPPAELLRPDALGPRPVVTSLALIGGVIVNINGSNLMTSGGAPAVTPNLSISNCGQHPLHELSGGLGGLFTPSSTALYFAGPGVPENETAQLSTTVDGVTSAPQNLTYPVQILPPPGEAYSVDVDDTSPYYSQPDGLGQGASSFATSGSHISTNFSDPTTTGTDTLGIGTSLVNGWTVTAQIGGVHSYLDAPSDDGSNDVYRSAHIVQQPTSGRLETKVAWNYEGGESISYQVVWYFSNGPMGTRQVSTMSKQTTCSDEQ